MAAGVRRHQDGILFSFILPPDDVRDILKLSQESMLRLRKAVYGLVNAPRWRDRLKRSLLSHGFTSSALDPRAFVLVQQEQIRGVTGVHVDDLLEGGGEVLDRTVLEVKCEFNFGAWNVGAMRKKSDR